MRNPARRRSYDRNALRELELFIDKDSQLYHSMMQPIVKNFMRKIAKGTFDFRKSVKGWQHLIDAGARKYVREFDAPGARVDTVFPAFLRRHLAKSYATVFVRKYRNGEFGPNPYSVSGSVGSAIRSVSPPMYNQRRRRRRA